uniref:NADH dehydrogenase subunit 2 n=1 Tax=Brueelia nebulosa TaxID=2972756 RepID=UPI0023AB1C17|nr:NADH dehydrogenase subunit 2 [Brueelia nebulosa]WCF77121.1 NADH dehydrogenase subunit 2 [Brueelia nebulosa]
MWLMELKMVSMKSMIMFNLIGSLIIASSSSWFSIWMGVEITSMTAFSIILSVRPSLISKINSWKYYMVQCYSSCIFFACILCLSNSSPYSSYSNFYWMVIFMSMILKMGIIPFHGWMFHISSSLPWNIFLILSTIQKIGPLLIISECSKSLSSSFTVDLTISLMISLLSISGMAIYSVRYFMITSSIINTAWMISSAQMSKFTFVAFILFYFAHLVNLFLFFNKEFVIPLESLISMMKKPLIYELMKVMTIMSLIGIPPMLGFFMKMSIMEQLVLTNNQLFSGLILAMSSSIIMMMYLKIITLTVSSMRMEEWQQFKFNPSLSTSMLFLFTGTLFYLV